MEIFRNSWMSLTCRLLLMIICAMIPNAACVSHESAKRDFIAQRDWDVGKYVKSISAPPTIIQPVDINSSEYHYEDKTTGCAWVYMVDNKIKKIIPWKYFGNPDLCYVKYYFRP